MKAIIIDDEAVAAAALKRRIPWEKYGIEEVQMAESMRQAIQIMEEHPMDLMLCDVEMPGGSGLELYEWVRTYRPETECIFVSCHPEYEYVRKALTMGSMDYVLKPVDYEEMDRILEAARMRIESRKSQNKSSQEKNLGDQAKEEIAPEIPNGNPNRNDSATSPGNGEETEATPAEAPKVYSESVQATIQYIQNHLDENRSIQDIAEVVHLNPQYFMRHFKKETGHSVLEFITECRLSKARELLAETNLPITDVALSVGYDNFSYFSQLFKRNENVTPSEYRRKARKSFSQHF